MEAKTWKSFIGSEFRKPYFKKLEAFVAEERARYEVYPPHTEVMAALSSTPWESVKAVIVGQDPYHGRGQAHGLAFSVRPGVAIPPSLANIFRELKSDLGLDPPGHGCLTEWARRGVLLLNTSLTVRAGSPGSHVGHGWEEFTDAVLKALWNKPCVFILWGKHAQRKNLLINPNLHRIVASAHPSPYSASTGFLGSRPFSRTNDALRAMGLEPIDWRLSPV